MKFLLDHDVSSYVGDALNAAHHETVCLADILPVTADDDLVFTKAYELHCVVVTCNRDDFLALANRLPFHGLIIVVRRMPPILEGRRILRLLERAGGNGISGNINFA